MRLKTVSIFQAFRQHEAGHQQLIRSLNHFGHDYHVIPKYRWFGDKMIFTAEYLQDLPSEYTHFLFLDASDTFALAGPDEVLSRYLNFGEYTILMSCEKAFWPRYKPGLDKESSDAYIQELIAAYPASETEWKHLNSGSYLAPIDTWLRMWEENQVEFNYDDQLWHHERFLSGDYNIELDRHCEIFQSIAHDHDPNKPYGQSFDKDEQGLYNWKTNTRPALWHGNGKTPMEWIYNTLP